MYITVSRDVDGKAVLRISCESDAQAEEIVTSILPDTDRSFMDMKLRNLDKNGWFQINFPYKKPVDIKVDVKTRAQPRTISEVTDAFIKRVLLGQCTPEETKILPVVLEQLHTERPSGARR